MKVNVRTMAKEMMEQTKNSILSQAAQAMLAQANQMPQGVLQLLQVMIVKGVLLGNGLEDNWVNCWNFLKLHQPQRNWKR